MNGRVDFQREMSAHHQLIRDCFNFTGPLDPLKGDAVYVAIQSTARETVDNLFNETLRNRNDTVRPVDSFAGAAVGSAAPTAVKGIGGGSRAPPAPKDDWLNRARGTFGGATQPAQPAQPASIYQPAAPAQPAQSAQPVMTGRYGAPAVQLAQPAQPAQPAPAPAAPASSGGFFSRKTAPAPAPVAPAPVYTPPVIKAGSAVTDGSYERKLVEELCTPQGMRPEPPKDKLTRFANACQTLDATVVGPILLGKLSDKNWKVVMKALYTIQEVLATPNTDGFLAYFSQNTEELQMLGNYPHPMVKKLAATVFDTLTRIQSGEQAEETQEPSGFAPAPAAPVAAAQPAGDFDFFTTPIPAPAASAPAPAPAAPAPADPFAFNAAGSLDDAFSFSQPAGAPASSSNDPFNVNFAGAGDINSAFQGLAPAKPTKTAAPAKPASFLDMYSTPSTQSAPAASSGFDFFSTPAPQPTAQSAPQPTQPMNYGIPQQPMNYGMAPQPAQQPANQAMNFDFFGM